MWGRQLVLGLGCDEGAENNAVNMLNMDTLTWESYDGNQARVGGAMGLLEGKLFLVGGQDGDARSNDVLQFNLGGFLMQFDGVDDEIMRAHPTCPHLPPPCTRAAPPPHQVPPAHHPADDVHDGGVGAPCESAR